MIRLIYNIGRVKITEKTSRKDIEKLQNQRFKKLLNHTLSKSEFYKKYYKQNGINIDNIEGIRLKDLPPINKTIIMNHYDDFVCSKDLKKKELEEFIFNPNNKEKLFKNKYKVIHTSGSTGEIGIFAYNIMEWTTLLALVMLRISKNNINPFNKSKLAFIGATEGHFAGISLAKAAPDWLFKFLQLDINSPISVINRGINDFQPDAIGGYSSGIHLLADQQLKGNINIHPKRIICSGDSLTTPIVQVVKEAFNIEPVNFYACSESIGIAGDCPKNSLHLFDDWHMVEAVDKGFQDVSPGKPGKVLLTNLYNFSQPLIRYEINDEIVFDDKKCKCHSNYPVIKKLAGRKEDFLWFKNKDNQPEFIHPLAIVEFFIPCLKKFQVVKTSEKSFKMKAVVGCSDEKATKRIKERMTEILREKDLEKEVKFDVEIVDDIENDPKTGKFKLILNNSN